MTKIKSQWDKTPTGVKISIAYALCGILQRCLSFVTFPLFTRLLTTEQYGQSILYQSWIGILSVFLTLNLAYGSFSTAMVKFENDRDGYILAVQEICLSLSIVFLVIYIPFQDLWNKLFELPTFIMCFMVSELIGSTVILFWSAKKRFEFKYKSVVWLTLVSSVLSTFISYVFVIYSDDKGYAKIVGSSIIPICIGCFFIIRNTLQGKKIFEKKYWKFALGFNVPLLFYYISQIVFISSDRIMISHMVGTDKAAIYGVGYLLAIMLTFVLNAINNSYVPWYYEKLKKRQLEDNKKVSLLIAVVMATLLLFMVWLAPEIIQILAGEQYIEAVYIVPPIALSVLLLFYSQLFINIEFYYEEKKYLVCASICVAVINLVMNWLFINIWGYISAAYTTFFCYLFFCLNNYFSMKKILKKKAIKSDGLNYKGLIGIFGVLTLFSIVGEMLYQFSMIRFSVIIFFIIILAVKKELFIDFYKQMK